MEIGWASFGTPAAKVNILRICVGGVCNIEIIRETAAHRPAGQNPPTAGGGWGSISDTRQKVGTNLLALTIHEVAADSVFG